MKEPAHRAQKIQLAFNRKVILWAHVVLGMLAAMVYLSGLDLAGSRFWTVNSGARAIFLALPALAPYIISAIISTLLVGCQHIRIWLFVSILTAGTVLGALMLLGVVKVDVGSLDLSLESQVIIAQSICYSTSAVLIFWR
jgi:hypothetical protein